MKKVTKRLIITNFLIIIIILIVYLLTFNSKVETAITSVYSNAIYKGTKNIENSVGMLVVIDVDVEKVELLQQTAEIKNISVTYMLSPKLIAENKDIISDFVSNGFEIGIYGDSDENMYEAIRILNEVNKNNILYVQKMRDIDKDIFSNELTVVVYSINVNIAYEKVEGKLSNYLSDGAFLLYDASGIGMFSSIIDAIIKSGYTIKSIGEII